MTAFIIANMAPLMFAALIGFLLLGYPIAFSLGAVGISFAGLGIQLGLFAPDFLQALPARIFGVMGGETGTTLLAVPFFTFMGLILERSGMAEDLLETVGQLFGTVRGGLAYAVILVGALLAATTGVVAASVISMGLISLPIMLRYGYDRRLASGVIAASGTLAQIIPPSLVLIILADQLGRPVHLMYASAFVPGLMLAGFYALYVFAVTLIWPHAAPGLPLDAIADREPDGSRGLASLLALTVLTVAFALWVMAGRGITGPDRVVITMALAVGAALPIALASRLLEPVIGTRLLSRLAERVTFVMVPPLFLIFLVLGTIFIGLATPTQGGAMGAIGALALAGFKRRIEGNAARLNWDLVRQAVEQTAKLSAFVMFILIGARIFSLTFYGVDGHKWVEHLLVSLPGGMYGFLILVNLAVFLLAFFLDFFELAFIIVPLVKPAAEAIFRSAPESIAIAKSFGMSVASGLGGVESVVDVGPFMVWFGVLLAVNMQTSFMHPPFGFALMFLRSVAPKLPYFDKVTGRETQPVTSEQIYWGAVPFVGIQLVMVALLILVPSLTMGAKVLTPSGAPAIAVGVPIAGASLNGKAALAIPGTPPPLEGARALPTGTPVGPSLDFSVPPKVD
jgi:TRAP-type mannitol/chloroaromatic compound transport system permease large subunit